MTAAFRARIPMAAFADSEPSRDELRAAKPRYARRDPLTRNPQRVPNLPR
jgi:hypothetical protein